MQKKLHIRLFIRLSFRMLFFSIKKPIWTKFVVWFSATRKPAVLFLSQNTSSPPGYKYHWFYCLNAQGFDSCLPPFYRFTNSLFFMSSYAKILWCTFALTCVAIYWKILLLLPSYFFIIICIDKYYIKCLSLKIAIFFIHCHFSSSAFSHVLWIIDRTHNFEVKIWGDATIDVSYHWIVCS